VHLLSNAEALDVTQDCQPTEGWNNLAEKFNALARKFRGLIRDSGNVASRLRKRRNKARADWVAYAAKDDRYRRCCLFCREYRQSASGDDNV
jgi:hypothetical protein